MICKTHITQNAAGADITEYTIDNQCGLCITAIDFGATLTSVLHSAGGNTEQLIIGLDTMEEYQQIGSYIGSTVGRVANRIENARIKIGDTQYALTNNLGRHTLHGGKTGLSYRMWHGQIIEAEHTTIRFTLRSPHMEEGFPGNLRIIAEYTVTKDNRLIIGHRAQCDCDTAVNMTNHGYWNLAGEGALLNHQFLINADYYLQTNADGICTGEMVAVDGGKYDFRTLRAAVLPAAAPSEAVSHVPSQQRHKDAQADTDAPAPADTDASADADTPASADADAPTDANAPVTHYDLCYHLNKSAIDIPPFGTVDTGRDGDPIYTAGFVACPDASRAMHISTSYPAMQLFLPHAIPVPPVPSRFVPNGAFCMECMLHISAHKFPGVPSIILKKGQTYRHETVHQFYDIGQHATY